MEAGQLPLVGGGWGGAFVWGGVAVHRSELWGPRGHAALQRGEG
jgi:hypothetical protein